MIKTITITSPLPLAFETMRTYDGRIRAFDQHLSRLIRSCEILRKSVGGSRGALLSERERERLHSQVKERCLHELTQRLDLSLLRQPKMILLEQVVRCYLSIDLDISVQVNALDLSYVSSSRSLKSVYDPLGYSAEAKHTARESWQRLIESLRCDELLLCDLEGYPLESSHSNFWRLERLAHEESILLKLQRRELAPLRGLRWFTPEANGSCLPGITRSILIDLFRKYGAEVIETKLPLVGTTETERTTYYLSSTLKSLSWIREIDDHQFTAPRFNHHLLQWVEVRLRELSLWGDVHPSK